MLDRKKMGETRGKVADLFARSREGLTVRETAKALKTPENTIDFHVRMLLAFGNLVCTGTAALEDLGRPGFVYADRKNAKTSKAWIAKHNATRAKATPKPKPAKKAKRKASKKSAPKRSKPKARKSPAKKAAPKRPVKAPKRKRPSTKKAPAPAPVAPAPAT